VTMSQAAVRGARSALGHQEGGGVSFRASRDPLRVFLFLLTLVTISRVHDAFPMLARLRLALALTGLVAVYALLNQKMLKSGNLLQTWPAKLMAGMFLFACLSAPFGISLGASGLYILDAYAKTILFAFLLAAAVRNSRDLYTFVWAMVVSSALLAWVSIFVYGMDQLNGYERLGKMGSYDANDIGCVLIVGLCLTMLTFQVAKGWGRAASAVILLGIGATIARSGSRGTLVALMVVGAALLALSHGVPVVKRFAFMAVLLLGLTIASPPGYWKQMSTLLSPTDDYNWQSTDGRKQIFQRGMGYMLEYPIFGLGINNFSKAECTISEKAVNSLTGAGVRCMAPHNSMIQAGSELGLPGMAMWLSLLIGGVVGMFRLRKRIPRAWQRGAQEERFLALAPLYFGLAMLGFAVTSFFVSFAWLDLVYALAALLAGLYFVVGQRLNEGQVSASALQRATLPRGPKSP
jgi:O-antigen ligase